MSLAWVRACHPYTPTASSFHTSFLSYFPKAQCQGRELIIHDKIIAWVISAYNSAIFDHYGKTEAYTVGPPSSSGLN